MKRQECSVTEVVVLLQQYPSVTGTRREGWLSAPLHRRNARERRFLMEKRLRPPFTPHINICLLSRLYPDTINPTFHLRLALKIFSEDPCETLVNTLWKLRYKARWQQVISFILSWKRWGFLDTLINLCQKVPRFVAVHLRCPRHIPERQTG